LVSGCTGGIPAVYLRGDEVKVSRRIYYTGVYKSGYRPRYSLRGGVGLPATLDFLHWHKNALRVNRQAKASQ